MKYPFYVNGIDERVRWEALKKQIWSDLYSCAMYALWDEFDPKVDDYEEFSNTHPTECSLISCTYCGKSGSKVRWNLEHILPRKYYPHLAFDLDNIVLACSDCNKEKCNKVGKSVGKLFLPYQKRLAKKKQIKILEIA